MTGTAIDWRLVALGLPKHHHDVAALQRAGARAPQPLTAVLLAMNVLLPGGFVLWALGDRLDPRLTAACLFFLLGLGAAMWAAWSDPGARAVRWAYFGLPLAMGLGAGYYAKPMGTAAVASVALFAIAGSLALWFLTVYRHQAVDARLRELDEQARAVALARQLAAAQIQPHFLFNALASLQHWVQNKDDRAAPMLGALTGFLRATLPLFDREQLTLGEEAEAVRQYLTVMQLRLGGRLRFTLNLADGAAAAALPPGLLLTLVENAVEHGVQGSLSGAEVHVSARADGPHWVAEVRDTGPGLPAAAPEGVGLRNSRERLAQAFGADARLSLSAAAGGGCLARIEWPRSPA